MELTVTEAATLLARSPRAVRAQLVRGELKGRKRGGQWRVRRADLPLAAAEHAAVQQRVSELRDALEDGIPRAIKHKLGAVALGRLDAFQIGHAVLTELRAADDPALTPARDALEAGLLALATGHHRFDRDAKLAALRRARDEISVTIARLLLADPAPAAAPEHAARLEAELLPRLAGLIRWAEKLDAVKR